MVITRSRGRGRSDLLKSLTSAGDLDFDDNFGTDDYLPELDAQEEGDDDSDDFILPSERRRRRLKKRKASKKRKATSNLEATEFDETPMRKRQRILKVRKTSGPNVLTDQEQLIKKAYKLLTTRRQLAAKEAAKTRVVAKIETKAVCSAKVFMQGHVPGLGKVSLESPGPSFQMNRMTVSTASAVEGKDSKERALKALAEARRKKEQMKAYRNNRMEMLKNRQPSPKMSAPSIPKRPTRRKLQTNHTLDDYVPVSSSARAGVMTLLPGISVLDALNGMDEVEQLEKLYRKVEDKLRPAKVISTTNPIGSSPDRTVGMNKALTQVYIAGLPLKFTQMELEKAFNHCGIIRGSKLLPGNRGIGFLTFQTHEMALNAIKDMNGRNIKGQPINVAWGRLRNNRARGRRGGFRGRGRGRAYHPRTSWVRGETLPGSKPLGPRPGLGFPHPTEGEDLSRKHQEEVIENQEVNQLDVGLKKDDGKTEQSPENTMSTPNASPTSTGNTNYPGFKRGGIMQGHIEKKNRGEGCRIKDQDLSIANSRSDLSRSNGRTAFSGQTSRKTSRPSSASPPVTSIPRKKANVVDNATWNNVHSSDIIKRQNNCWVHPERRRAVLGDPPPEEDIAQHEEDVSQLPKSTDLEGLALVPKRGSDHKIPEAAAIDYGF